MATHKFIPDVEDQDVSDIVEGILANLPSVEYTEVKLPSLASKVYGIDGDSIHLRPITFEDEKAMLSLKDNKQSVNLLISRCMLEDIDPKHLLVPDKHLILMNLRAISMGKEYDASIKCSKCGEVSEVKLDILNTFPCKFADTPIEKTVKVKLPVLGKTVEIKRGGANELEKPLPELLEGLWRFVLSIDGQTNAKVRNQVISKLPRKDIHFILSQVTCSDIGLDPRFVFSCSFCQHEELTSFEIGADFFTMQ